MYLAESVKAKIQEFVSAYPLPRTNDEDSANWTHKLCEQLKFSFPTDGWGHKSAGPGRPHSADVIALANPFWGWDIIINAGSPDARLNLNGEYINLVGQIYEPVAAYNYLSLEPPVDPPPTNGTIEEKLNLILATMAKYHEEEMAAITAPRVTRMG